MNGYSDWDGRSYLNISLSRSGRTLNVDRLFDVIVYRLGHLVPSRHLAKFTELQYAPNICPTTSLTTLDYCRKQEGSGTSMVDNNEGIVSSPSNQRTFVKLSDIIGWAGQSHSNLEERSNFFKGEGSYALIQAGYGACVGFRIDHHPQSGKSLGTTSVRIVKFA